MKKVVFKQYDKVKIINPEFVVRVGYPLSLKEVKENLSNDIINKIKEITKCKKSLSKILNIVAYDTLIERGFGGNERKIHTRTLPEHKEKIHQVMEKRIVKTGKYNPSHSYQGYYDDYPEYEPAYLSNSKTHVILGLDIFHENYLSINKNEFYLEIEECNVEKVS